MPPEPFATTFRDPRLLSRTTRADLWAATDVAGNVVHIVQLSPAAAADPDARAVLGAAAAGTQQAPGGGPMPIYGADLAAAQPWVAAVAHGPGAPIDVLIGMLSQDRTTALPPWAPPVLPGPRKGIGRAGIAGIVVAALVLLGGAGWGITTALAGGAPMPAPTGTPVPSGTQPSGTQPSGTQPSGTQPSGVAVGGRPVLKAGPVPVVVAGATFAAGEATYTMALHGWPFAFRTPPSWGCMPGRAGADQLPGAESYNCIDEKAAPAPGRAAVTLAWRACPDGCAAPARAEGLAQWFGKRRPKAGPDDRTHADETATKDGEYVLSACRYFGDTAGGAPNQLVCVFASARPDLKPTVQKIVNEVLTQAS
jgi:hypothetical protein